MWGNGLKQENSWSMDVFHGSVGSFACSYSNILPHICVWKLVLETWIMGSSCT
jgi:hypothetical protein